MRTSIASGSILNSSVEI